MGRAKGNLRRIHATVQRVEQQPYDFAPGTRMPRLSIAGGWALCRLNSNLNAATGTWPTITPTSINSVTLYRPVNGSLVAISGTHKVWNFRAVGWNSGKTSFVVPLGDGTWNIVDQDC